MQGSKKATGRTVTQGKGLTQSDVTGLLEALDGLPTPERGKQALMLSSLLSEYAAFELAGSVPSETVGELIETSASLTRVGKQLSGSPEISGFQRRAT